MEILNPDSIYNSPRYYSGLKVGHTIYTAGRVPIDFEGNVVAPNDAGAQTHQIMEDLQTILAEGGATFQDVVHIRTYYLDEADWPAIHEVRQRFMGDHYPPHTGAKNDSQSWRERGIRLEIEAIAVIED